MTELPDPFMVTVPGRLAPPPLEQERLRETVYRRVFGAASPVEVGRFTVLGRIGSGGMGLVFKAYDMQLDRTVAVKVIRLDGALPNARKLLAKEARALARLSHPNVVHVYEVGEAHGGELYLAMEFVDGVTLRQWLGAAQRGWRDVIDVCLQAAEGLAAAHAAGLVHRDFKPENVMVGDDARVRVLDFGLARSDVRQAASDGALDGAASLQSPFITAASLAHGVAGTPGYMAPEQLRGGTIGPCVDQFAFCATLFEALYGVRPFEGTSLEELRANIEASRFTVAGARLGVPKSLHRAIVQGLAADPGERHASIPVLIGEIRRARLGQRLRRWAPAAATAIVAGATLAVGVGVQPFASATVARDDELIISRAELQLRTDPTAAVRTLAELSADAAQWNDRAGVVAEQAEAWGLADRELALAPEFRFLAIAGDHGFGYRAETGTIVAVDLRTAAVSTVQAVATAPGPKHFDWLILGKTWIESSGEGHFMIHDADALTIIDGDNLQATRLAWNESLGMRAFAESGAAVAVMAPDRIVVRRLPGGDPLLEVGLVPAIEGGGRAVIALDKDGSRLAVAVPRESTRIYQVDGSGETALPDTEAAQMLFAGPDRLITAGAAGGLRLWDLARGIEVPLGAAQTRHVSLEVVDDGAGLATRTDDDEVHVWDFESGRERRFEDASELLVSRDRRRLAWRSRDGHVHVLDVPSMVQREVVVRSGILNFEFSADSGGLVTYSEDRVIRHWPLPPESPVLRGHKGSIADLAFSPTQNLLYSAGRDHTLRSWDLATGTTVDVVDAPDVASVQVSDGGEYLVTVRAGAGVEVRSAEDPEVVLRTVPKQFGGELQGNAILVADEQGIAQIDIVTGARTTLVADARDCHSFALDPVARRLAASCGETMGLHRDLRLWDLTGAQPPREFPGLGWGVLGFHAGHLLQGGPLQDQLELVDLDGEERTPLGSGRSVNIDLREGRAAVATYEAGVEVHDLSTRGHVTVPGTEGATVVALSPDGRHLAYANHDGNAISIRSRPVPPGPDDLRKWVLDHQVERLHAR